MAFQARRRIGGSRLGVKVGGRGTFARKKSGKAAFEIRLEGFHELSQAFNKLPVTLQKKALKPALKVGAKIIQADAKRLSKRKSGDNKRFIKIKSMKRSRVKIGWNIVTGTREQLGIDKDDPFYYPMVLEYGSRKQPAYPYMRPALKNNRIHATNAIGVELGVRMDRVVNQLARKKR